MRAVNQSCGMFGKAWAAIVLMCCLGMLSPVGCLFGPRAEKPKVPQGKITCNDAASAMNRPKNSRVKDLNVANLEKQFDECIAKSTTDGLVQMVVRFGGPSSSIPRDTRSKLRDKLGVLTANASDPNYQPTFLSIALHYELNRYTLGKNFKYSKDHGPMFLTEHKTQLGKLKTAELISYLQLFAGRETVDWLKKAILGRINSGDYTADDMQILLTIPDFANAIKAAYGKGFDCNKPESISFLLKQLAEIDKAKISSLSELNNILLEKTAMCQRADKLKSPEALQTIFNTEILSNKFLEAFHTLYTQPGNVNADMVAGAHQVLVEYGKIVSTEGVINEHVKDLIAKLRLPLETAASVAAECANPKFVQILLNPFMGSYADVVEVLNYCAAKYSPPDSSGVTCVKLVLAQLQKMRHESSQLSEKSVKYLFKNSQRWPVKLYTIDTFPAFLADFLDPSVFTPLEIMQWIQAWDPELKYFSDFLAQQHNLAQKLAESFADGKKLSEAKTAGLKYELFLTLATSLNRPNGDHVQLVSALLLSSFDPNCAQLENLFSIFKTTPTLLPFRLMAKCPPCHLLSDDEALELGVNKSKEISQIVETHEYTATELGNVVTKLLASVKRTIALSDPQIAKTLANTALAMEPFMPWLCGLNKPQVELLAKSFDEEYKISLLIVLYVKNYIVQAETRAAFTTEFTCDKLKGILSIFNSSHGVNSDVNAAKQLAALEKEICS